MHRKLLQRHELLVYFCIGLVAVILFGLASYVVTTGMVNSLISGLSSNLLSVAMIFFIVNRIFITNSSNEDKIEKISNEVEKTYKLMIERENNAPGSSSSLSSDIEKIHLSLININHDITELTKKITSEIDKQQGQLLKVVSEKFSEETNKSNQNLRKAIEKELRLSLSQQNSQNQTVERLVELIGHSIQTMGSFQRSAIEEEFRKMFIEMQQSVGAPTENLSTEVKVLQEQVQEVRKQINLPVPSTKTSQLNLSPQVVKKTVGNKSVV